MNIPIIPSEAEKIWLEELLRRYNAREPVDTWKLRIELRDRLPKDFSPAQINPLFLQFDSITLLGIIAVDPDSKRIRDTERTIASIRDWLIEDPKKRTVTAEEIAKKLDVDLRYAQELLLLMSTVGSFWTSGSGTQSGTGYFSVTVGNEQCLREFLAFENIEKCVHQYLERRRQTASFNRMLPDPQLPPRSARPVSIDAPRPVDREKFKGEIQRLTTEASRIAPSIARFERERDYGNVTDEALDTQSLVRWELEAASILRELAASSVAVFKDLHDEYVRRKKGADKFHSRSILVHQILELLLSASQLMDSPLTQPPQGAAKPSDLNPWPVIRSFLLHLSSYEVPEIVDRAGLTVDWALSERENHSHKMRLAAYRPRIDTAYQSLANNEDRLRVAYIVAQELARRGSIEELNDALREIGWELRDNRLVPSGRSVRELFFPEQSHHDAYVGIRAILQTAKNRIVLVDPYIDQSILTLLSSCTKTGMNIRILTSKIPSDFALEARRWLSQHIGGSLEVRTTREFHDRFIILDDAACWHVGSSIKDAGNKAFMLSEMEDHDNRTALLAQVDKSWATGVVIL